MENKQEQLLTLYKLLENVNVSGQSVLWLGRALTLLSEMIQAENSTLNTAEEVGK